MSTWLQRFTGRLAGEKDASTRGRSITEHFYKRSLYGSTSEFLSDLAELFPPGEPIASCDLRVLLDELCGLWGAQKALIEGELEEHIVFWRQLALRTSCPCAMVCHGDSLLEIGREEEAFVAFSTALRLEPGLMCEFDEDLESLARRLGGAHWLQYRLTCLRSLLLAAADAEDDAVRELYSELLEEFSGDSTALDAIYELGKDMEAAVARGDIPRAMVRRGDSRKQN